MPDYRLQLMAGVDIPVTELQIVIHPPIVEEIARMGEKDFFMAMQYLCLDKQMLIEDKALLSSLSNFQVLMKVLEQSKDKHKKNAVQTLLLLLFPNYKSMFLPSSIILTAENIDPFVLDDNNFDVFQDSVKQILCVNSLFQGDNIIYNPANEMAQKIADKLMESKKKIAKMKSNGGNESVLTRYLSVLTVAKVASLQECIHMNLFQLFDLMERYTANVEWDIDLRARLAGSKPDKTVESWMRDMHPMI